MESTGENPDFDAEAELFGPEERVVGALERVLARADFQYVKHFHHKVRRQPGQYSRRFWRRKRAPVQKTVVKLIGLDEQEAIVGKIETPTWTRYGLVMGSRDFIVNVKDGRVVADESFSPLPDIDGLVTWVDNAHDAPISPLAPEREGSKPVKRDR